MNSLKPLSIAAKGKGLFHMLKRISAIGRRYGLTTRNMDQILSKFRHILETYNAKATFPITGTAVARSNGFAPKHQGNMIEYAVHGYYHVDHAQLSLPDQEKQLSDAKQLFSNRGISASGFRCPYLRWNDDTLSAIRQAGFSYDSSQALAWDLVGNKSTEAYNRVLKFYGAVSANEYPALPSLDHDLVRIPYCLPDDEALIDRLVFPEKESMNQIWLNILRETHRLGELFTLGLHPERLNYCESALIETLQHAEALSPAVWFARLDEIANWWKIRTNSTIAITEEAEGFLNINVSGPNGVTVLVRGIDVAADSDNWDGIYQLVHDHQLRLKTEKRPIIGVSPTSDPYLFSFLQQQGYLVEMDGSGDRYSLYLDRPKFSYEDQRPLLTLIEDGDFPLVRLGRWPHGRRSALCITGDIDALTIWDYGLRFFGN